MGLDISHDCWHGAYSAFMRWRIEIGKAAGISLPLMEGFWGYAPYQDTIKAIVAKNSPPSAFKQEPGGGFTATRGSLLTSLSVTMAKDQDSVAMQSVLEDILPFLPLKWEQLNPDPIHILLSHSDCEGEIASSDCGPIADSLSRLLPLLDGDGGGHIGNYREKTQKFIDGLRLAASLGENVEFL